MKLKEKIREIKQKMVPIFHVIKKIFPYWKMELSVLMVGILGVAVAWTINNTATVTKEMEIMNSEFVVSDNDQEVYKEQQSQFSINNPDQEEPILTSEEKAYQTSQLCLIGNQIFSSMQSVLLTDTKFLAASDGNIAWFNETVKEKINLSESSQSVFLVSLGLNDLDKASDYVVSLNDWVSEHADKEFLFVTITPIDETRYHNATNESIQAFNTAMKNGLNESWEVIDLYQYIIDNNIQTTDGINYSISNLANMFSWLVNSVAN